MWTNMINTPVHVTIFVYIFQCRYNNAPVCVSFTKLCCSANQRLHVFHLADYSTVVSVYETPVHIFWVYLYSCECVGVCFSAQLCAIQVAT